MPFNLSSLFPINTFCHLPLSGPSRQRPPLPPFAWPPPERVGRQRDEEHTASEARGAPRQGAAAMPGRVAGHRPQAPRGILAARHSL